MILRIGILLAGLVVTGAMPCHAQQSHFDDRDAQFVFSRVEFPAVADTFAVMSTRRWPDPSVGVSIHYASPIAPAAHLDIYVSPIQSDDANHPSMRERVTAEFDRSLEGIKIYAEQRRQDTEVTVERTDSITLTDASGREHFGWVADVTYKTGSKSERSLLYQFEKDGSKVKYRITHEQSLRTMLQEHIDAFILETLERVYPRQQGQNGSSPDRPELSHVR